MRLPKKGEMFVEQRFDIKPADVFVSFTGADREIKNKIIDFLKSKKISCLESDDECCGDYREWSIEAPNHCSLFLPIITKNIKDTSIMKEEYESLQKQDDYVNRIIPISTNKDTYEKFSFDMHEKVSTVFCDDLEHISQKILEDIYSRVIYLLIHMKCRRRYNPPMPTKHFVGRGDILKEIHEKLKDYGTVFISGIGGIGKTELVKKYVKEYVENNTKTSDDIFNVIYLKYDKDSNLSSILRSVEKEMPIAEEYAVFNNPQTLVILDNFDTENDEGLDDFLSRGCKKIITTRYNGFEAYESKEIITLDVLPYQEQYKLFKTHYGYDIDAEDENVNFILNFISGLTVFIPILAKQCGASKIDLADMCEKLKEGGVASFKDSEKFNINKDYISSTPGNALELARVIFKIAALEDKYITVLRNLSLLQFMYVNADKYKEFCMNKTNENLDKLNDLIAKNWVIENRSSLSPKENTFELHPIINDLVREDLKPSPNNCPEVFLYIDNIIEKKSFLNLPPIEKKEFVVAFINNTSKENIPYFFEKYGDYVIHIKLLSDQLLLALKSYILNKKNFSSKEYRGLTQLSELLYFSVEEIEKIIILLMDSNENNRFERQLVIENVIDRQARFHSQDTQFGVVINRYGFKIKEETDFIFATLKTKHNRSFDVVQRNLKKINSIKRDILNSENDEKAFAEYIKGVQTISTKSDITYLSAILCEKCMQNKKNYEEIRNFEKFIYSNDSRYKRILLRQFLIYYKYFEIKGMSIEKCENLIEDVVCDRYTKKQLELMIYYVCKEKNDFDKKLKRYFELIAKNKSIDELITPIIKLQDVFNYELEEMPSDYLLSPLSQSIEFLECCFGENIAYNTLFELVYEWGEHIAEACDDRQLADVYSKKLRKIKKMRLGYELK